MALPDLDLTGSVIAMVGGDRREQEIARRAALTGASVRGFGFPWPDGGIAGVEHKSDARGALDGARFALFPIPGIAKDGALFAPAIAPERIIPDADLLSVMAPDAHIILGAADDGLRAAAEQCDIGLHEYEGDVRLMLLRGPAIIEGALKVIVENTERTIHDGHVCVVGQGTIGTLLTRTLVLLGAHTYVAARNPVQRAAAHAAGAQALPLEDLPALAGTLDVVLSTVPAPVVGSDVIERLPDHALVVDLAAPPGGADLAAAEARGLSAVWARGLGGRAPVTVGASQWSGIAERIGAILAEAGRG
jgi:dipicolinate synthase subunit A